MAPAFKIFKHSSDMGIASAHSGLMVKKDWYCNILKILNLLGLFEKKTDILVTFEVKGIEENMHPANRSESLKEVS